MCIQYGRLKESAKNIPENMYFSNKKGTTNCGPSYCHAYLFIKALPYDPIIPIYPETPFLFFKGVPIPRAFDISEETARDIENFMKGQNSAYYTDLRLHDLDQNYLDSYESAIRIYNDMLDKTRRSYQENVKLAKSQVMEISAVLVCLLVIIITIIGIS